MKSSVHQKCVEMNVKNKKRMGKCHKIRMIEDNVEGHV